MVAKTRGGAQPSPKKLKFHDKLVGKGLSTDTLLKKLKTLHTELADLDQETVDTSTLGGPRKELIHQTILLHKDRGVKAYAACCLADLLRLYAPDAPYTHHELRDIFQFFFRQLSAGLTGPDAPYYNEYFHLLESLSTVKSVVLVCDLPNSDELMVDIFRSSFNLVRLDLAKKVEMFLADILVALIDESHTLPSELLETILAQFKDRKSGLDNPAYRLAVQVCNATADKLQRHVCQYFTDIILAHTSTLSSSHRASSRDSSPPDSESTLADLRSAHSLIKQLNRSCPSLLHNVIPQLEEELKVEDVPLRTMATQVLGEMFGDGKAGSDLARKYPTTWNMWLMRKNDKVVGVRLALVEAAKGLIANLPELREQVEEALQTKMFDPDEKVRAATCKVYSHLDYETALHHVSKGTLQVVVGRGLDKKHSVRVEAMNSAGKLYSLAFPEIEAGDPAAIHQFAWIPQAILQMISTTAEVKAAAEQVLAEYIFPLPSLASSSTTARRADKSSENVASGSKTVHGAAGGDVDEVAWTDRLLLIMRFLDEGAVGGLLNFSGIKAVRPTVYERFIDACEANNGGVIDDNEDNVIRRLNLVIQRLAATFTDPQRATDDLQTFAKMNEKRLYKLLRTVMDPQTDLKTLVKTTNEVLKRIDASSPSILPTFTTFLRRSSLRLINQSSIPTLLKRMQNPSSRSSHSESQSQALSAGASTSASTVANNMSSAQAAAKNAQAVLIYVSKHLPQLYKPHIAELTKGIALSNDKPSSTRNSRNHTAGAALPDEEKMKSVEVSLQALACVGAWDEKVVLGLADRDKRTGERVRKYVVEGNERCAKFAARLVARMRGAEGVCGALVNTIADALEDVDEKTLVAHIAVLSEFAHVAPDAFEEQSEAIMTFLVKKVLMIPAPMDPNDMDTDTEWVEDGNMTPSLRAKLLALKVCRNRCMAHAEDETALDIASPVLKMFLTLLGHSGSLTADAQDDPKVKSRMRLQAAVSLLHLSTMTKYSNYVSTNFVLLALTIQDPCYEVRHGFLQKAILLLKKLPAHFNLIPFLTVHDPEADVKTMAKAYVSYAFRSSPQSVKVDNFEMIFVRFLHLLAHHPDFALTQEGLHDMAKYIDFYLELISTADNVSLLYHLAGKAKTVRDSESHVYSENLYALSELAQHVIKQRAQSHSWTLQSYPGKVKLFSDILRPLPSPESVNEILKHVYLPAETMEWLKEQGKALRAAAIADGKEKPKPVRKRKAAAVPRTNGQTKRPRASGGRRKSNKYEDDDSDEEESSEGEEDDQDEEGQEDATEAKSVSSSDEDGEERRPKRGARTKANEKIKQQVKKKPAKRKA